MENKNNQIIIYNGADGQTKIEVKLEDETVQLSQKQMAELLMYMRDWVKKLDGFLILNDKEILSNNGSVSHQGMEERVRCELARYNQKFLSCPKKQDN